MNLIQKIRSWLPGRKLTDHELAMISLDSGLKTLQEHLIALARLNFVKPETLVREAKNVKDNADYLLKMIQNQNDNQPKS